MLKIKFFSTHFEMLKLCILHVYIYKSHVYYMIIL